MLLKRDGEVQRHIARYSATIEKAKQQPTPSKEKREPVRPRLSENTELRQVKSEIQREKMEILALENMLAELEVRCARLTQSPSKKADDDTSDLAQVLQGKPEPASPAAPPVDSPHTRTPSKRPLGASVRDRPLGQSQSQGRGASALRDRFSASLRSPEKAQSRPEPRLGQSTRAPVPSTSRTPAKSPSMPLRNRAAPPASPLAQSVAGRTPERRTPAAARMRRTLDGTPRPPLAQSVGYTPGRTDELRSTATPPHSPATPQRARAASPLKERSPAKPALLPPGAAPDPSAELERAAAQIWLHFGESLRYVAPAATAAPFSDTFTYLSTLECCGQDPATARMDGGASADDSMHAPSGISALSAQSSTLEPSAPLSVNTVVMAHILLLLFRTPAPHSLTLASVKTLTESWWRQRGQAIFRTTAATPELADEPIKHLGLDAGEVDQKGDVLGSRAVYGLVSKKILRIHRVGGAAAFRFA